MNKLLACTTALLLLLGSGVSLADDRHRGDQNRGYDRHDNRDYDRNYDRRRDRDNVSFNVNFVNSVGRNWVGNRGAGNHFRSSYRDRNSFNSVGFGIGYSTFGMNSFNAWNSPSWAYNNPRPVVVYQNTYIDNPAPRTRVITRSGTRTGTSLLRDVQGRCFERETDRFGNETRTELPASACNF